ncbi:MAG TPA: TetR/AcrR family transcriptional regulator [Clostridia bacterium]|nr:TetR/AcrR family transcriptional regulator [Clostridia bacterium]
MNLNDKNKMIINERKRIKKKEISSIALRVFSEMGIDQTNMTDIAKTSEVGVATLYRYFDNKTNLVIETGVEAWSEINSKYETAVEKIIAEEILAIDKLEKLLNLFYKIFTKEKAFVFFLDGFDNYIVNNSVSTDMLETYEDEILRIDPYVHTVYKEGLHDQSIKKIKDIDLFIKTIGHSLLALSQKALIRNRIVKSDRKERLMDEMKLMIEMVVLYAKK